MGLQSTTLYKYQIHGTITIPPTQYYGMCVWRAKTFYTISSCIYVLCLAIGSNYNVSDISSNYRQGYNCTLRLSYTYPQLIITSRLFMEPVYALWSIIVRPKPSYIVYHCTKAYLCIAKISRMNIVRSRSALLVLLHISLNTTPYNYGVRKL